MPVRGFAPSRTGGFATGSRVGFADLASLGSNPSSGIGASVCLCGDLPPPGPAASPPACGWASPTSLRSVQIPPPALVLRYACAGICPLQDRRLRHRLAGGLRRPRFARFKSLLRHWCFGMPVRGFAPSRTGGFATGLRVGFADLASLGSNPSSGIGASVCLCGDLPPPGPAASPPACGWASPTSLRSVQIPPPALVLRYACAGICPLQDRRLRHRLAGGLRRPRFARFKSLLRHWYFGT